MICVHCGKKIEPSLDWDSDGWIHSESMLYRCVSGAAPDPQQYASPWVEDRKTMTITPAQIVALQDDLEGRN
jgi:hypothetical protein